MFQVGGGERSKGAIVRGESLTESFCKLSLGLEMDKAVHSLCKVSALLI